MGDGQYRVGHCVQAFVLPPSLWHLIFKNIYSFIHLWGGGMRTTAYVQRSENNLLVSDLSVNHVDTRN